VKFSLILLYYSYIVFILFDGGSVFLTFIHVPDDGSAEPKHAVYLHNLGVNWCSVQNEYILWCVRLCLLLL
jgi:hypothetical protein